MVIVTIIIFILILALLIFVHEMGHFIAARLAGVKVEEFGMGFPPRLFAVKRGETVYSFNLIPLGGFCKLLGEEDPSEPRSLASKRPLVRLFVLGAGSFMMFVLPFVLLPIGYMIPHEVITGGEGLQVSRVESGSPAEEAGIKVDDMILSVDGEPVHTFEELQEVIDSKLGSETMMVVSRGSAEVEVFMVPRADPPPGQGPLGIGLEWATVLTERRAYLPWEAIPMGVKDGGRMFVLIEESVESLIRGDEPFAPLGIVGAGQAGVEIVAEWGLFSLVAWACLISIQLGIINLLPIPALDGGRIVFVLIEVARRGKRVSPRTEGMVHLAGFLMLISLVMLLFGSDIARLIRGETLLP